MKWKVYNEYIEVSDNGQVKVHGKLVQGEICANGYKRINTSHNGINQRYLVHRLVAMTFIPNPENKPTVNHKDGNKLNNCVSNLEWCTYGEQMIHAYNTNLRNADGENNPAHKLTKEDVEYIRTHYVKRDREFGFAALARKFGVDAKTVEHAYKGVTWNL